VNPIRIPLIDLSEQHHRLGKELKSAVARILDSQQFILKNELSSFEAEVAKKVGSRYAVGMASGSDALYLSLVAGGVGVGDEVITTPFTFFATAGAISRTGATPVFADIDGRTFNLDPEKVADRTTRKTKAIVPVHLFGLPSDMDSILQIAKKKSLFVVEDAAQSLGASFKGRQTGTLGDTGCFSFYPTKNLGAAGDAGMVVTSSKSMAEKLKLFRNHGSEIKYHHKYIGINSRMDEIQASILRIKFRKLNVWNKSRQQHARDYDAGLRNLPLKTPVVPRGLQSIYHLYSILTDKRDSLAAHLAKKGIGTGVYYPLPLHLQPCYKSLGYKKGDFAVSESVSNRILSLPMFPELKKSQKEEVISEIKNFFKKGNR
jgi:dTDP-4-amino-4,6-dideoxygalactose transaminase